MSYIIEEKDPRGITIRCELAQWENHIIDRADGSGHPIMKDNIESIKETIRDPEIIVESNDSDPPLDTREIYIKETVMATYHDKTPITKVVVSICGGSGEIVTAFNTKKKEGGWSSDPIYIKNE